MSGYVELQRIPYRTHDLLTRAVFAHTKPGDSVLEGGVSSGYFAQALVESGRIVDGVEIDPVAAEEARSACRHVIVADLQNLDTSSLDGPYDLFLFGDTLEHLADPEAVLVRLKPLLKPSGTLVLSLPNIANWAIRLSLLLGRFNYTERGILDRTHLRFYTRRTLLGLLDRSGFRITKLIGSIPVPGTSSRTIARLAHLLGNLWPSLFAYQFVVTAVPRSSVEA